MEEMREAWTDARLDDLNGKVDDLGRRMDSRFDRMDDRLDRMDDRFGAVQRLIVQVGAGMIATFAIGFLGVVVSLA